MAWPSAEVVGVDINPQPNYPFEFVRGDALTYPLDGFDFIWASPPCQAFTRARKLQGNDHPNHIPAIRERLEAAGVPYCIENVPGAPLRQPLLLCGSMFDLMVYRHRIFETNYEVPFLMCQHHRPQIKMGRPVQEGDVIQVVGHFSNVPYAGRAMGIDWMNQGELAQAIPPLFSYYIATHARMKHRLRAA